MTFQDSYQFHSELTDRCSRTGKCGYFNDAHKLFDHMPQSNTFFKTRFLRALIRSGILDEAGKIFKSMPEHQESLKFFVKMHIENFTSETIEILVGHSQ